VCVCVCLCVSVCVCVERIGVVQCRVERFYGLLDGYRERRREEPGCVCVCVCVRVCVCKLINNKKLLLLLIT